MTRTVYVDSSAAAKLILREPESGALVASLGDGPTLVSSELIRVELLRAVRREEPDQLARTRRLLGDLLLREIDDEILSRAALLDPPHMRSLDAIHLATAVALGDSIDALLTYDQRMIDAAKLLGLPVASPA